MREITLLGQIVTSYGKRDIPIKDGKSALCKLLEAVHTGRITFFTRFTLAASKRLRRRLGGGLWNIAEIVESAYLPLQSGAVISTIAETYASRYTRERLVKIIEKLRQVRPHRYHDRYHRGLPGETEADFMETLSLAREVEFDNAFISSTFPAQRYPRRRWKDSCRKQ